MGAKYSTGTMPHGARGMVPGWKVREKWPKTMSKLPYERVGRGVELRDLGGSKIPREEVHVLLEVLEAGGPGGERRTVLHDPPESDLGTRLVVVLADPGGERA